jgi:hypothetical protein
MCCKGKMMNILKAIETDHADCTCSSWLEHWNTYSGQPLSNCCAVLDCVYRPEVGALVRAVGSEDDDWYIVPLCKEHTRQKGKSLYLTKSVKLVSRHCRGPLLEAAAVPKPVRIANPYQVYIHENNSIEAKDVL